MLCNLNNYKPHNEKHLGKGIALASSKYFTAYTTQVICTTILEIRLNAFVGKIF